MTINADEYDAIGRRVAELGINRPWTDAERDRAALWEVAMVGVDPGVNPPTVLQIEDRAMTDDRADDRIDIIERWLAATDQCIPVFAIRWLLGDWRRLKALQAGEEYLCTACWEEFKEPDAAIAREQADG